eukprot:388194-Ditylum_brightwellii.AAC.2
MVDTVQKSVETAISPSVNSTIQMESIIKKVCGKRKCTYSASVDTSNSVMISTITGEGNITMMPKDNTTK